MDVIQKILEHIEVHKDLIMNLQQHLGIVAQSIVKHDVKILALMQRIVDLEKKLDEK